MTSPQFDKEKFNKLMVEIFSNQTKYDDEQRKYYVVLEPIYDFIDAAIKDAVCEALDEVSGKIDDKSRLAVPCVSCLNKIQSIRARYDSVQSTNEEGR